MKVEINLVADRLQLALLEVGDLIPRQGSAARMSTVSSPMPSPRARLRHSGIAPSVRGKPEPACSARKGIGHPARADRNLEAVQRVLEESGVEFITGDNGPGVRLRLR